MKIMKTKIRTLLAIGALGIIGLININAIADNKKSVNTEVVKGKEEMLTIETWNIDETFLNSAEELTAMEADLQIEKYASKQIFLQESGIAKANPLTSAEFLTASGTDREIEKYAEKQVSMEKTKISK